MTLQDLKQKTISKCLELLNERIDTAQNAAKAAQEAANNEEKSTAGDKYDTSRAMNQRDNDMYSAQLNKNISMLNAFKQLDFNAKYSTVQSGAMVKTSDSYFLIATGLGLLTVDNVKIAVISSSSPIAESLLNKKVGEKYSFRQIDNSIHEIC